MLQPVDAVSAHDRLGMAGQRTSLRDRTFLTATRTLHIHRPDASSNSNGPTTERAKPDAPYLPLRARRSASAGRLARGATTGHDALVSDEKLGFLLFGVGFCALTFVLYRARAWFAQVTVAFMFFSRSVDYREQKAEEAEEIFEFLFGRVFPPFMAIWFIAVLVS